MSTVMHKGFRGGTEGMLRVTLISPTWQHVSRDEKSLPKKPPLHSPKKHMANTLYHQKQKLGSDPNKTKRETYPSI
jgi:hypothetical protein